MLYGALWCIAGIIVTTSTYSSASSGGGTYYICWGAILFGFLQFMQGLFQFLTAPDEATQGSQEIKEVETLKPTEEQQRVLELLSQGLSNLEIAEKLGISPVHTSLLTTDLLQKFGVADKAELIRAAQNEGYLPPT
jgi:DNA-binding CsgD family transcriptional regulator